MPCYPTNKCALASQYHELVASIDRSRLVVRSSINGSIVYSSQLSGDLASHCKYMQWCHHRNIEQATNQDQNIHISSHQRLLVANDDTVVVYEIDNPSWSAVINGASGNTGKIAHVEFGFSEEEVLVISDFSVKATLWSLVTSRGAEIRDPKSATCGHCFRPRSGHLAILTRPTTRDIVVILKPETQELSSSFTVDTEDAQGLTWSPDGQWLTVWDASSTGLKVLFYTPDGNLFKIYHGGQDLHNPGLGTKTVAWDPSGRYLAIGTYYNEIILLNKDTFSPTAIFQHSETIQSPNASLWQEQIHASGERSYVTAVQPACPPTHSAQSNSAPQLGGISHLLFNANGTLLASRSESMPTTVWIWSLLYLAPKAILIHHSSVRNMQWNPVTQDLLMIQCATNDSVLYFWGTNWDVPHVLKTSLEKPGGRTEANWVFTMPETKPKFVISNSHNYMVQQLLEEGEVTEEINVLGELTGLGPEDMFDEGNSMDLSPIKFSPDHFAVKVGGNSSPVDKWDASGDVDDTFDYRRRLTGAT